jgi:hypothetical protein
LFITIYIKIKPKISIIFMKWGRGVGMDWIDLPQDKDMYWALVNVVMNIQVA